MRHGRDAAASMQRHVSTDARRRDMKLTLRAGRRAEVVDLIQISTEVIVKDITLVDKLLQQDGGDCTRTLDFAELRKLSLICKLPSRALEIIEQHGKTAKCQASNVEIEDDDEAAA